MPSYSHLLSKTCHFQSVDVIEKFFGLFVLQIKLSALRILHYLFICIPIDRLMVLSCANNNTDLYSSWFFCVFAEFSKSFPLSFILFVSFSELLCLSCQDFSPPLCWDLLGFGFDLFCFSVLETFRTNSNMSFNLPGLNSSAADDWMT